MRKKIILLFSIVSLLFISTPICLFIFGVKTSVKIGEKKMSLNFKRNFPLKSELIDLYFYNKKVFIKTNPLPRKAVQAKNGWKFLGDYPDNALSESKGIVTFSKKEIEILKKNLIYRKNWLEERGIKMYLAIAPNKLTVYGDMIPIEKKSNLTKKEQLDSLCRIHNITYIDLGKNLQNTNKELLYYKADTHWTDFAGYEAFKVSINQIQQDFPKHQFKKYPINELYINYNDPKRASKEFGDLNRILGIDEIEKYITFNFKVKQPAYRTSKKHQAPNNYTIDPRLYSTQWKSPTNSLKAVILHDSFLGAYQDYMYNNFGTTTRVWDHSFNEDLISEENPDIFYHQIVERKIDVLLN